MKTKIKNIKKRFFFGLNLIKVAFNNTFKFFAIFIPSWTHTKRFLTALMISIFFLSQYGYIYDAYAQDESANYLKWIRCVLRTRAQSQDDMDDLAGNEKMIEEDKFCISEKTSFQINSNDTYKTYEAYNVLKQLYEEMYGKPDEYISYKELLELETSEDKTLDDKISQAEADIRGDSNAQFSFETPPTEKSSLRYIFEYYLHPDSDFIDRPEENLNIYHSYVYNKNKTEEFYDKFLAKIEFFNKSDLLYKFMQLYTNSDIKSRSATAGSLKLKIQSILTTAYGKGNGNATNLNDIANLLSHKESSNNPSPSLLNKILKDDQGCTGDSCKAARALTNSGARIVMDILLLSEISFSRNFGDLTTLSENPFLKREYFMVIGRDFLNNKSGFMNLLYKNGPLVGGQRRNPPMNFEANASTLTKYFDQIKISQDSPNILKNADFYWKQISLNNLIDKPINEPSGNVIPDRVAKIKASRLCNFDITNGNFNNILKETINDLWPLFVIDPNDNGEYVFSFDTALVKISEACNFGRNYFDGEENQENFIDKDGNRNLILTYTSNVYIQQTNNKVKRNLKLNENGLYLDITEDIPVPEDKNLPAANSASNSDLNVYNSKGEVVKSGKTTTNNGPASLSTNNNPTDKNSRKFIAAMIARGAYFNFNRYYKGYESSFLLGLFDKYKPQDNLGYETIANSVRTGIKTVDVGIGNFVSDYVALHGTAYGDYKNVFDPTQSIDLSVYKAGTYWNTIRDMLWFPIGFFQTMFCDVNGSGILGVCTNPILAAKKQSLNEMSDAVKKFTDERINEINALKSSLQNFSISDVSDPYKMFQYETNVMKVLALTSILDNAVLSFFSEIIQISGWVDRTRRMFFASQIAVDIIAMAISFGAWGATKLAATAFFKSIRHSKTIINLMRVGNLMINNPVSRIAWGFFNYLRHPFKMINVGRLRILHGGSQFVKGETIYNGARNLDRSIAAARDAVAKAQTKLGELSGSASKLESGMKSWGAISSFRTRIAKFRLNVNKDALAWLEKSNSFYVQRAIAKSSLKNNTDEISKILTDFKNGKGIKDAKGVNIAGAEAQKSYARELEKYLEINNPAAYQTHLGTTAAKESLEGVDDAIKNAKNWDETTSTFAQLKTSNFGEGKALLPDETIAKIAQSSGKTLDNGNLSKIQEILKSTKTAEEKAKGIESLIKSVNKDKKWTKLKAQEIVKQHEGASSLDNLLVNYKTLSVDEQARLLEDAVSKIHPNNPLHTIVLNIKTKYGDSVLANVSRGELKAQRAILQNESKTILAKEEIKNLKLGEKKIEEVQKIADDLLKSKKPKDKQLLDDINRYINNDKSITDLNKLIKETSLLNKVKKITNTAVIKIALIRGLILGKTLFDISRIIDLMRGVVYVCDENNELIEKTVADNGVNNKNSISEDLSKELANIHGAENPEWQKKIDDIIQSTNKIRSDLIPNVYQNLLILKRFGEDNANNNLENFSNDEKSRIFKILKLNLLISLTNLNSALLKFDLTLDPCGADTVNSGGKLSGQERGGCLKFKKINDIRASLFSNNFFNPSWSKALKAQSSQTLENASTQLSTIDPANSTSANNSANNNGEPCILSLGNLNIGAFNAFAGGSVQGGGAEQIISRVIKIFMIFAGSFAVLAMVYAGLLYTYSNGEEESLTKAKDVWFHAILGLIITMFSYFAVSIIEGILYSF